MVAEIHNSPAEAGCDRWMRDEVERVSNSAAFARAPVMRRLLHFLAEETIAGRGDELKAYSVAVDGLGRSPEFDPQADSYPRVQVGRLRRMIDQFYQREEAEAGSVQLHIPVGSYRVHALAARSSDLAPPAAPLPPPPPTEPEASGTARRRRWIVMLLIGAVAAAVIALAWLGWRREPPPAPAQPQLVLAPLLSVSPVKIAEDADPLLARRVERIMNHALHRSYTVRLAERGATGDYRLVSTLVGRDLRVLYLTVRDRRAQTQIWSTRLYLPVEGPEVRARLTPAFAAIMSPTGVIGSTERRRSRGSFAAGYPCMLHYAAYFTMGNRVEGKAIQSCLSRTVQIAPDYAPARAALVHMRLRAALDRPRDLPKLVRENLVAAQRVVQADPFSPEAQMALATAASAAERCELSSASIERALDLNPYDAHAYARAGLMKFGCGDRDFAEYLRRAWELDASLPAVAAIPLLIAQAEHGRGREALTLANRLPQGEARGRPGYDLTIIVGLAAAGERDRARTAWRDLAKRMTADADAPAARVLERILFIPGLARRIQAFLEEAGVAA